MRNRILIAVFALAAMALAAGCGSSGGEGGISHTTFKVRIENVSQLLKSSGVFNTPAGAAAPAPIFPGDSYQFTVSGAQPGERLSFVTMMVQSNDLFYAPGAEGIELFNGGTPISGNVTGSLMLWDAGTEVNQEPGAGSDQAPRQSGPDTGQTENGVVRLVNDGHNYPDVSDVLEVLIAPSGSGSNVDFTVTITNVSDGMTLQHSQGFSAVPLAPGLWVTHFQENPLFTPGMPDFGDGLEAIAEDGDPSMLSGVISGMLGFPQPIAPGVWALHTGDMPIFSRGQMDRGLGLEALAEDGDPSALASWLSTLPQVAQSGVFNTPAGASAPAPAFTGQSYEFEFTAEYGTDLNLSFATMYVQSNDLFYAPMDSGIRLFPTTGIVDGDVTSMVYLWDAGTEVNQMPGTGADQAPRQAGPNHGLMEDGDVERIEDVNDGFSYPSTPSVIRVTISR